MQSFIVVHQRMFHNNEIIAIVQPTNKHQTLQILAKKENEESRK